MLSLSINKTLMYNITLGFHLISNTVFSVENTVIAIDYAKHFLVNKTALEKMNFIKMNSQVMEIRKL